jgi:hypothetical protein
MRMRIFPGKGLPYPYLVLILDISLLKTLPNSIFFLRVDLMDCHNWYNFQAIWAVIFHGISIEVWKIRIGLFWILLYKPHYVRFLDKFIIIAHGILTVFIFIWVNLLGFFLVIYLLFKLNSNLLQIIFQRVN